MKKMLIVCGLGMITAFMSGCSSSNTANSVPPIYYDYGYTFNERIRGGSFVNHSQNSSYRCDEHKHEYIKFDYRTR